MKKHFLITVSEQKSALYGIRFISKFFSNKDDVQLTLFYTCPQLEVDCWGKGSGKKDIVVQNRQNEEKGKKALEAAKKKLMDLGFQEELILTKLDLRKRSRAHDILHEGAAGRYDAVILGKRGLGRLEQAFEESVTKTLIKETFRFPIWLCKQPVTGRKGVLLCIDGSDASYRMADHVGYVLTGRTRQPVTLMTVNPDKKEADRMLAAAEAEMLKNNFPKEMIKTLVSKGKHPANAILKEADNGKYAVVAVGRREREPKRMKSLFFGSVSALLFDKLEGASLWICH